MPYRKSRSEQQILAAGPGRMLAGASCRPHIDASSRDPSMAVPGAFGFWGHKEDDVRRARAAYYGLVSFVDDRLGRLLDALDGAGLTEETLVIHTSDHGELLGEHGLWRKMSFYEQSARVPLQMRWPGQARSGVRVADCVSLVDVTATIVDAAGATNAAAELDGTSLIGLLRGEPGDWKDEAFAELTSHGTDRPRAMLRRGHYKLSLSAGTEPEAELYDLRADPGEFHNLAGRAQHAAAEAALSDALRARWDGAEVERRVRAAQERRILLRSALGGGRPPF